MTDFLLELLSEEIPARMQDKARDDLARLFSAELDKAGLKASALVTYATPRRLTLIAKDLPLETQAVSEETKGPKVGAPPQAMEGFLRKTGLTQDQLVERDGVYFAVVEKPGRKTADVLAEAIPAIIRAFPWPKSQRWGAASHSTESLRWVRPLQGIIALLGDDVVPCEIDGISSGSATMGHRFHHSGPVTIGNAGDYAAKLKACHVIVDQEERRAIIRAGAEKAAADAGLVLVPDEGLVNENSGLTEWPVPMLGRFDPDYLSVPEEVIQLTARVNQKYFICRDAAGKLANAFVCTANIVANDGGAAIVAGNEKVLAARLSDARFFYETDLKTPLDVHAEKLKDIVFHEKLGTVSDKVDRVAKLARWLVEEGIISPAARPEPVEGPSFSSDGDQNRTGLRQAQPERVLSVAELADLAVRAASLAKADLVTGMVGEFPELQGLMGGYYAAAQGEDPAVAAAVRDHYKPVGQGDEVPTAPVTVAVSLADKLDTLASFFDIELFPTGSKDPFALRRAALGINELIRRNGLKFEAGQGILLGWLGHSEGVLSPADVGRRKVAITVVAFLLDRLEVLLRDTGIRHDFVRASRNWGSQEDGRVDRVEARARALQAFVTTEDGTNLLAGYKRAANILKQSPAPDGAGGAGSADLSAAEQALQSALDAAEPKAVEAIEGEQFGDAMAALATLRGPIDTFFDAVMVNDPDPHKRAFRLGLLARFRDAVHRVADFSKIEG
ncbi:glycine--tRNA ligase subunit beta [Chakrabartia godavariana]|nr:glycine--tRNA ligase subunit beta [Chakrabartia godavariana]